MSNEYIFFDPSLRDRFLHFAGERGLAAATRRDSMDAWVVALPDALDDALEAAIEAAYDALMIEQRDLVDAEPNAEARRVMGVSICLPDGATRLVRVPGAYGLRLMEHFSVEEIRELVGAIAVEVLAPDDGALCRRQAAMQQQQ